MKPAPRTSSSHATAHPARLELHIGSEPCFIAGARRAIERFVAGLGFHDVAQGQLGLCVNEALANVIRHAYAGAPGKPIVITATELREHGGAITAVRVTIRDWGNGVNPQSLPPKPYDPLEPGGVGLICLQELLDEVSYTPQPDGGVLLTMTKRKP